MLIKPSICDLEKINEDRYLMTTLIAKRARELREKRPITEEVEEREVAQAAKEVAMGLITFKNNGERSESVYSAE